MTVYTLAQSINPWNLVLRLPGNILKLFFVLNFALILSLLGFYIFQVNSEVAQKYSIPAYSAQLNETLKENQNMEFNLVQSNSLNGISSIMQELNFEKTDKIHYIRVLENKVVVK
tara:strand:- start:737 stop:1081 length:345 start_codon:yes stop_codon:yes gene_type:complete